MYGPGAVGVGEWYVYDVVNGVEASGIEGTRRASSEDTLGGPASSESDILGLFRTTVARGSGGCGVRRVPTRGTRSTQERDRVK